MENQPSWEILCQSLQVILHLASTQIAPVTDTELIHNRVYWQNVFLFRNVDISGQFGQLRQSGVYLEFLLLVH